MSNSINGWYVIKDWLNIPVIIKPFIKRNGTGENIRAEVPTTCYASAENKLVRNKVGSEVVSSTQLYLNGKQDLDVKDCIIFEDVEHTILNIKRFYNEDGTIAVKVVYI